jgi:hypothetical protein
MKTVRTVLATMAALALTATHQAAAASAVQLTNADDGRTVSTTLGGTATVRLVPVTENGVRWTFAKPVTSDPQIAAPTTGTQTPDGGATASFDLVGPGDVVVTATRSCVVTAPGGVCPSTTATWRVTLTVA